MKFTDLKFTQNPQGGSEQDDDNLTKALTYAVENNFITMSQAFEIIRNL